jgi:hypothetical protein
MEKNRGIGMEGGGKTMDSETTGRSQEQAFRRMKEK